MSDRTTQAATNRASMPFTSAMFDDLKQHGLSPRVTYATEGECTLGRPDTRVSVVPVIQPTERG